MNNSFSYRDSTSYTPQTQEGRRSPSAEETTLSCGGRRTGEVGLGEGGPRGRPRCELETRRGESEWQSSSGGSRV